MRAVSIKMSDLPGVVYRRQTCQFQLQRVLTHPRETFCITDNVGDGLSSVSLPKKPVYTTDFLS